MDPDLDSIHCQQQEHPQLFVTVNNHYAVADANGPMPSFTSFPLVASFIYGFFVHRLPLLSLQEYATSFQSSSSSISSSSAATTIDRKQLEASCWDRLPPVWPHSLIVIQRLVPDGDSKIGPATTVTYYDYDQGGNLIQITPEAGDDQVLWDLELNTGHSFYFTPAIQSCRPAEFPVGILRPNWLQGAAPLGPSKSWDGSGRVVCGWTKVDFIDYYVDAITGIPDSWYFHTMKASFQVLNYTANPAIDPALFVPPDYCD